MKKMLALCLSVCVLLVCSGCSAAKKPVEIPEDIHEKLEHYETMALVQYGELDATVTVERDKNRCELDFQKPEALRGLHAVMEDGKATISYGVLSLDLTERGILDEFMGSLLVKALNHQAADIGVKATLNEEGFSLAGSAEGGGSFDLLIDAKTGFLVRLDYPDKNLHVEFYEFRFTKPGSEEASQA